MDGTDMNETGDMGDMEQAGDMNETGNTGDMKTRDMKSDAAGS